MVVLRLLRLVALWVRRVRRMLQWRLLLLLLLQRVLVLLVHLWRRVLLGWQRRPLRTSVAVGLAVRPHPRPCRPRPCSLPAALLV